MSGNALDQYPDGGPAWREESLLNILRDHGYDEAQDDALALARGEGDDEAYWYLMGRAMGKMDDLRRRGLLDGRDES